jgi:hypothetical protein
MKGEEAMKWIAAYLLAFSAITAFVPPAEAAETCSQAVVHCRQKGIRHTDNLEKCTAAGAQCMQTGTFIGPYTATVTRGFIKQ